MTRTAHYSVQDMTSQTHHSRRFVAVLMVMFLSTKRLVIYLLWRLFIVSVPLKSSDMIIPRLVMNVFVVVFFCFSFSFLNCALPRFPKGPCLLVADFLLSVLQSGNYMFMTKLGFGLNVICCRINDQRQIVVRLFFCRFCLYVCSVLNLDPYILKTHIPGTKHIQMTPRTRWPLCDHKLDPVAWNGSTLTACCFRNTYRFILSFLSPFLLETLRNISASERSQFCWLGCDFWPFTCFQPVPVFSSRSSDMLNY